MIFLRLEFDSYRNCAYTDNLSNLSHVYFYVISSYCNMGTLKTSFFSNENKKKGIGTKTWVIFQSSNFAMHSSGNRYSYNEIIIHNSIIYFQEIKYILILILISRLSVRCYNIFSLFIRFTGSLNIFRKMGILLNRMK